MTKVKLFATSILLFALYLPSFSQKGTFYINKKKPSEISMAEERKIIKEQNKAYEEQLKKNQKDIKKHNDDFFKKGPQYKKTVKKHKKVKRQKRSKNRF